MFLGPEQTHPPYLNFYFYVQYLELSPQKPRANIRLSEWDDNGADTSAIQALTWHLRFSFQPAFQTRHRCLRIHLQTVLVSLRSPECPCSNAANKSGMQRVSVIAEVTRSESEAQQSSLNAEFLTKPLKSKVAGPQTHGCCVFGTTPKFLNWSLKEAVPDSHTDFSIDNSHFLSYSCFPLSCHSELVLPSTKSMLASSRL
jgi:hypothetical protein